VRGNVQKKIVQQGRSPFDARSVLSVREHGKMATMPGKPFRQSQGTPLAAFFNIPLHDITPTILSLCEQGE